MRATLSAVFHGSGRLIHADHDFGRLQAWARSGDVGALREGEVYADVQNAIAHATTVSEPVVQVFRGRIPPFDGSIPTSAEMGPPKKAEQARAGRYNVEGQVVLYCSTSDYGVQREMQDREGEVWSQPLQIPTSTLRVADFRLSSQHEHHLLNNLFWFAELAGAGGYPDQTFSRFVANMVAERFDGMLVPGVRGVNDNQYENLIVFAPTSWTDWLVSVGPSKLRS